MKQQAFKQKLLASIIGLVAAHNASANTLMLEEMVVTAQKRAQTLQEVPIAVSAFSDNFMVKTGVKDVRGLVALTPGFAGATEDSYIDGMSMRGISTNDFGVGGDPSIAMFQDGFWMGRNGGVQSAYFDVERVEIVKGPQATLFGRNAIAGAISVTTKKPIEEFEGKVKLGLAENDHIDLTTTVNIPLTDNVYFRGSVYGARDNGWLENLEGGDDYGYHENSGTRLALRYAGETVDATLTASYEDREQNSSLYWDATDNLGLNTPKDKVRSELKGEDALDDAEIASIVANVEIELNDSVTLTSITGWKTFNHNYLEDTDGGPRFIVHYASNTEDTYYSQEFRLNGVTENITWFAGVSAYKEDIDAELGYDYNEDELCAAISRTDVDYFPGGPVENCSDPAFYQDYWGVMTAPAPGETLDFVAEHMLNEVEANGAALYGDLTFHVNEALDVTVGARYTQDTKKMTASAPAVDGWLGNNINTLGPVAESSDQDTWDETTFRLAVNYQLNDDISFYTSFSEGYKSGGFSSFGFNADTGEPDSFDPELVDSYEVGAKTQWLDNRLHFNAALYYFEYEDMQLSYFEGGSTLVANVGAAEVTGIELDARYLISENWEITATASYQDSEIVEDKSLEAIGACVDCKGNQLPLAPESGASLIATYTLPVTSGEYYGSVETLYSSDQYSDLDNQKHIAQDSWTQVNLRLGYESNDAWTATLWVENLNNDEHFERGWANFGYGFNDLQTWISKPRTVGVDLSMSF
ncbi:TonB-dependent receptor [Dasania marina]|uniref:TonB-dependent receptor n=1 Tax=Dasania marina TaxID=471499 RepID=UPI00036143D0|nr:TonB-dependent receptor [Dasania marina]